MVYKRLPDNTADILRKRGLKVREVPGWKTRGRPPEKGDLNPVGVLCHHTASSPKTPSANVIKTLVEGRGGSDPLPGPLAQFGLDRDGTVYLVASGRANHAGKARAAGSVAAGDGNELYWGIEGFNDGLGENWPKAQMDAYVLLCAVLQVDFTKNSHRAVNGHKETSVTGKPDPLFNMSDFRVRVSSKMARLIKADKEPNVTKTASRGQEVDEALKDAYASYVRLKKAHGSGIRAAQIRAARAAMRLAIRAIKAIKAI